MKIFEHQKLISLIPNSLAKPVGVRHAGKVSKWARGDCLAEFIKVVEPYFSEPWEYYGNLFKDEANEPSEDKKASKGRLTEDQFIALVWDPEFLNKSRFHKNKEGKRNAFEKIRKKIMNAIKELERW